MRVTPLLKFLLLPLVSGFPQLGNRLSEEDSARLQELKQALPIKGTNLKPNHFLWRPPGPNDRTETFPRKSDEEPTNTLPLAIVRSPCPALNTLANHGFLPRDGRNITLPMITRAAKDGLNVGPLVPLEGFTRSVITNPIPNATVSYPSPFYGVGANNSSSSICK
jgi:peroxidase family protein